MGTRCIALAILINLLAGCDSAASSTVEVKPGTKLCSFPVPSRAFLLVEGKPTKDGTQKVANYHPSVGKTSESNVRIRNHPEYEVQLEVEFVDISVRQMDGTFMKVPDSEIPNKNAKLAVSICP
jgi:hypothetical protein